MNDLPPAVSRAQLVALGMTDQAIATRLRNGSWQRLFPGTFAPYSGDVGRDSLLLAAVLYAGPGAALCRESAAAEAGWLRPPPLIHVQIPARRRVRHQPGLAIHRSRRPMVEDLLPDSHPPRTAFIRTVVDLVLAAQEESAVISVLTSAVRSRPLSAQQIRDRVSSTYGVPLRSLVLEMLSEVEAGVHSPLELRFSRAVRLHGLPEPLRQTRERAASGRVQFLDTLFDPYEVVAELDGLAGHSGVSDRFRDMHRDNANAARGRITLRYGWHDVVVRPCQMAGQVGATLVTRGWPGPLRRCGPGCGN